MLVLLLVADRISYSSYRVNSFHVDYNMLIYDHPKSIQELISNDTSVFINIFQKNELLEQADVNEERNAHAIFSHLPEYRELSFYQKDSVYSFMFPSFLANKYRTTFFEDEIDDPLIIFREDAKEHSTEVKKSKENSHKQYGKIKIMGKGMLKKEQLMDFLLKHNDSIDTVYTEHLVEMYIEEAQKEGVNHDVAFIQMCHETDFLKYTGVVKPEQKNFCGLGTINENTPGEYFESEKEGIRAHIQHLKAYASKKELNQNLVDVRFYYVQRGVAPVVEKLTGRWATDPAYHNKIKKLYKRLEAYSEEEDLSLPI